MNSKKCVRKRCVLIKYSMSRCRCFIARQNFSFRYLFQNSVACTFQSAYQLSCFRCFYGFDYAMIFHLCFWLNDIQTADIHDDDFLFRESTRSTLKPFLSVQQRSATLPANASMGKWSWKKMLVLAILERLRSRSDTPIPSTTMSMGISGRRNQLLRPRDFLCAPK